MKYKPGIRYVFTEPSIPIDKDCSITLVSADDRSYILLRVVYMRAESGIFTCKMGRTTRFIHKAGEPPLTMQSSTFLVRGDFGENLIFSATDGAKGIATLSGEVIPVDEPQKVRTQLAKRTPRYGRQYVSKFEQDKA